MHNKRSPVTGWLVPVVACAILAMTACGAPEDTLAPATETTAPDVRVTATARPATDQPAPTATTVPPTGAASATPVPEPTATLTAWEAVQAEVRRYRNRLDSNADSYVALGEALEQAEPNAIWCGGLNSGVADFNYSGDTASADALARLKDEQGCP